MDTNKISRLVTVWQFLSEQDRLFFVERAEALAVLATQCSQGNLLAHPQEASEEPKSLAQ